MNPKIEMDVKPKIEYIDDSNKGIEIIGSMNIPVKAGMQDESLEKYKCFVCTSLIFPTQKLMIEHMNTEHSRYIKKMKECIHCETSFHTNILLLNIWVSQERFYT